MSPSPTSPLSDLRGYRTLALNIIRRAEADITDDPPPAAPRTDRLRHALTVLQRRIDAAEFLTERTDAYALDWFHLAGINVDWYRSWPANRLTRARLDAWRRMVPAMEQQATAKAAQRKADMIVRIVRARRERIARQRAQTPELVFG